MTGYVVCTSPRSGSTLLCHMLKATRKAGVPESLFNGDTLETWGNRLGVAPADSDLNTARALFVKANQVGRGSSDVFGLRAQRHSFALFTTWLGQLYPGTTDAARLEAAFGPLRYIFLRREDKLRQAASFVRAGQTGLWHRAADGSELERLAPPAPPQFDADALAQAQDKFVGYDADWTAWFDTNAIQPLRLTYETLADDPRAALRKVLRHIDLPEDLADVVEVPTQRLADAVTEDWVAGMMRHGSTQ